MSVQNQGQRANSAGFVAEELLTAALRGKGYIVERQKRIGHSIYNHHLKADMFVWGVPGYDNGLIIESKWQQRGGSVDEKFPYLVENIRVKYPCPTIVVYGGDGAKPGAITWLRSKVDGRKLLHVMTIDEFLQWMNQL